MAPNLRARGNTRGSKTVASNGSKRKRDEASDSQSNSVPKKWKGKLSVIAVPDKQTSCQKAADVKAIIEEFRIEFHPRQFSPERPGNVPKEHQTKFKHIQQLGQMKYKSYALQPRADIANKPWELENKLRATRVSEKAVESRIDNQNEDGWRMELENRIFERFGIEVACQHCRKRLWESFISVNHKESNSRTTNLAERQGRRSPCTCEQSPRQYSILNTGFTKIFSTRIGERSVIQGDPENHRRIEMKPDRIYGLRTTDTIKKILEQPHVSHLGETSELEDGLLGRLTISCNPDSGGLASIYPFLVMEAKSLKGASNFQNIENQTAVPIRNLLYLQHKLQEDEFNKMKVPGGPLAWFFAYVGEQWRVYGCYVTKAEPDTLPYYNIVCLWEGSITSYDAALQLVLIVDYIVDWARDIFRLGIMRQLMSVLDKGTQSTYTIVEDPDILSTRDYANSWIGERPVPTVGGAEVAEVPAGPAFDAINFTIVESHLEPLFKSTGKHVDIRVWEGAKYEARVRGLYITGNDTDAKEHFAWKGFETLKTRYMDRCWFLLSHPQDIKTIEQAWTGSEVIKDVQDLSPQKILISLYVQYRKDGDGALIRELTYIAVTESAASQSLFWSDILKRNELVDSAGELELKLGEAWTSSNKNYFRRYVRGQTDVLCVTASDSDRLANRVVLSFHNDRETTPYARRLDSFIKATCENPRAGRYKIYATCFRTTKAVHSLTVEPHCVSDPTQACVFINAEAMPSGICAYVTTAASEEVNNTWLIRHLVQMVVVGRRSDREDSAFQGNTSNKTLLWIVSDPQWDLYIAIKSTLTMPGMKKVHKHLAWFRKVLLRHKCENPGFRGIADWYKWENYRNIQEDIQDACKECNYEGSWKADSTSSVSEYEFCDEDYMPK